MQKDLSTFFEKERNEQKTFKEIKISLKELLHDTKKENRTKEKTKLIQKSKEKIENNIIQNLEEGLKILSGDYLYPLKYLTTYNTVFTFSKNADNIIPGDILKLEGEKLIILRKGKKINIGKIIKKINTKKNSIKQNNNTKIIKTKSKIKEKTNYQKFNKQKWEEISDIYLNNIDELNYDEEEYNIDVINKAKLKEVFNNFYEKQKIPNLSKENILELTKNDYLKAITIVMIYKNEQGSQNGFLGTNYTRNDSKNLIRQINKKYPISKKIKEVKSIGKWQIRTNSIGLEKLNYFFKNTEKLNLKFITKEDKQLFEKLKDKYIKNKKLTKEEKIELLENENLSTILVNSILKVDKKRISFLIKKIWGIDFKNKDYLNKQEIFFITSKLADSYHLGPLGAIIGGLFTDNTLKIAEKLKILEKDGKILVITKFGGKITNSYQIKIRDKYRGIINNLIGKTDFYKRNTEIQKETIYKIINYLEKNNLNNKYNIKLLKIQTTKIRNGYVPTEIISLINDLNKQLDFSILDITANDYKKYDPKKAILVGNYGPKAWRALEKPIK